MKTAILTLDLHDDLISIRDKLAWAKSPRILLVWPLRRRRKVEAPLVLSRLDLTLLARHARRLGAQLALVTVNPLLRAYAAEAGVAVFNSADEAQEGSWRKARRRTRRVSVRRMSVLTGENRGLADGSEAAPPDLRAARTDIAQPAEAIWKKDKRMRIAVFGLAVLAVFSLLLLFWPAARIRLSLAEQPQQVRLEVWASPEVAQALVTGALPAQMVGVVVEGQQQCPSSGKVWLPEIYASGQVVLSNLTQSPIRLPAGTALRTLADPAQRFELTAAVQVPGGVGQAARGSLRALQPGVEGNVAAHTIQSLEGASGAMVMVDNPEPLSGGSQRLAPAPTEGDTLQLRQLLSDSLRQRALQELSAGLQEGDILLSDSLKVNKILLEQRTPAEGTPADMLQLTMRLEFSAWTVQKESLRNVAAMALQATMPKGFSASVDSLEFRLEKDFVVQGERQVAVLSASWQIHSSYTPWQVVQAVIGRSPQEAGQILQTRLALSQLPIIELSPPWWPFLPLLPAQILVIEEKP
jgi:hypothetical protein